MKLHNPFTLHYSKMSISLEIAMTIFQAVCVIVAIIALMLLLFHYFKYIIAAALGGAILFSVIRILWYVFRGK